MAKFKVWTGPVTVAEVASKLRNAGMPVTLEGTESVYFEAPIPGGKGERDVAWSLQLQIESVYGIAAGYRVVRV
jgi:hypothetical protein